jgi:diguanylate cyclase (GGDEF)-like protein
MRDALTGVHNRRYFGRALKAMIEEARKSTLPLTVLVLDVDNFKSVNDAHGHTVGDSVLKEVVERIRPVLRSTDILSRYGGEEFAIILGDTPALHGIGVAEQICADIAKLPMLSPKGSVFITVSCGVATLDGQEEPDKSADGIVARADQALHLAKKEGRNRVKFQ